MTDNAQGTPSPKIVLPPAGGSSGRIGIFVVIGLVIAAFLMQTVLLIAVGMLPTIVAFWVDPRPEKYSAFCVGSLNFCGLLPFVLNFWKGTSDGSVIDPFMLFAAFGTAGIGYLIYNMAPTIAGGYLKIQSDRKIGRLREYQQELIDEWGQGITAKPGEKDEK
jgi:4-hydroxybenzoate polyprenyltransferase